jgi:hypothetical protein
MRRQALRASGRKEARVSAAAIGVVVAALVFAGGVLGTQLHRFLPPEHMSKES